MEIKGSKSAAPGSAAPGPKPVDRATPRDRVEARADREIGRAAQNAQAQIASVRTARLQEIKASVKEGRYRPDPGRIAEQILRAAEDLARLRALLER